LRAAQLAKERAIAQLRQIELDKELKRVALIDDVSKLFVQALSLIRTRILALPTALAPDLAEAKTPAAAQKVLSAGINELLGELCAYVGDFEENDAPAANVAIAKQRILDAASRSG
jgi:hypothetical protein